MARGATERSVLYVVCGPITPCPACNTVACGCDTSGPPGSSGMSGDNAHAVSFTAGRAASGLGHPADPAALLARPKIGIPPRPVLRGGRWAWEDKSAFKIPILPEQALSGLTPCTSPRCGCGTEGLFERARKGGIGLIADHVRDLGEGGAGVPQLVRGDLHAPGGEVVHRCHTDQMREASASADRDSPTWRPSSSTVQGWVMSRCSSANARPT